MHEPPLDLDVMEPDVAQQNYETISTPSFSPTRASELPDS